MSAPRRLANVGCKLCSILFRPIRAGQKFCSQNCADENRRRVCVGALAKMVHDGASKAEMCRAFGVSYTTIRRNIAEYGLEGTWREQRYA